MKKRMILAALMSMMVLTSVSFMACGSSDDDETEVVNTLSQVVGTWVCTASKDVWNTERGSGNADDVMVGETLTIKQDGTYVSSSGSFGSRGTWSVQNGRFSAETSFGRKMNGSVSLSGSSMRLKGNTDDGYNFDYSFVKK